jgi:uncharacterized protein
MPHVTEINIYPVKACGRVARDSEVVGPRGLEGDRRYMLVDAAGRFLTQRQHPRLALIRVADDDARGYRLDAPGMPQLTLPRAWDAGSVPAASEVAVTIWRTQVHATAVGDEAGAWFAHFLGVPCSLVYQSRDQHRAVPNPAAQFDDEVSFADGAPLLLTSEASLAELNSRLDEPVTMRRFRPNLVVDADEAFAEDAWRYLRVGEAEFDVAWPCSRCVVTTIDPETGIKSPSGDPLRTLRGFRKTEGGVMFGQNLIPRRLGRIGVGDLVEIA